MVIKMKKNYEITLEPVMENAKFGVELHWMHIKKVEKNEEGNNNKSKR